jgi:uncharacterized peroxidase-related enzyme
MMAHVKIIPPEQATGKLKEEYDTAMKRAGYIANILRVQSLTPETLHHSTGVYISSMLNDSGLSRAEREMIAVVVSKINECFY